jgi:hypothetical protein
MTNKPKITEELIAQINGIISRNPEWNRTRISKTLCEVLDWRSLAGQIKDISCRDMLRALECRGLIRLPQPIVVSRQAGQRVNIKHLEHETTPVTCGLSELLPLNVETIEAGEQVAAFKSLIDQYHYLGFGRTVGENMKYMIRSHNGKLLACMLFGSAAWACRGRDLHIGWDKSQREGGLQYITNNTRFLILPWVKVPHLASHILGKIAHRISGDWHVRYGHGIYCLETFVERGRFKGTCYKASNWRHVGSTTGRGRNSTGSSAVLPIKDVYLQPLRWDFRVRLTKQGEGLSNVGSCASQQVLSR